MILELKAKHFEGTVFCGDYEDKCAIEKAYTELTGNECYEGVKKLSDYKLKKDFIHEEYNDYIFISDKIKAQSNNFDETIIRIIELTEL